MTYDPDMAQLCEGIFKLAEGAPEDREDFVSGLGAVIERYGTDDEQKEDYATTQLVFSLLGRVAGSGTEKERRLAVECSAEFVRQLCGYTYTEEDGE